MSEINAIATNNFILHNIDAKKLYVQEPLFTANSGDAVYVGWRPDETVLWSGSTHTSGADITLSEPYTAFDTLKIYANGYNNGYQPQCNEYKVDTQNAQIFYVLCENRPGSTPGIRFNYFELSGHTDYSKLRISHAWQFSITANAVINTSGTNANINYIVGVNRKENA